MASAKKENLNVVETIIFLQSILLLCFGLAGTMASSTVTAGFKAMTNANSAVMFITDSKVVTETEEISTEQAEAIINNFQIVCTTSLTLGIVILAASTVRLAKKSRLKKQSQS
jgi:hypothetical protein